MYVWSKQIVGTFLAVFGVLVGVLEGVSGFSVGCSINREKVICYQLEFGK